MAFALALVSFSCTGPIIGTLLVQAAAMGELMGPAIGMLGFSLALAIPFTLFASFPSLLKTLPKSGGWLNSVKVTLGFIELALAFKFLSNVDLAYHWEFLDREVFLVLWIVIFAMMGFYLLGKLKFSHDSDLPYIAIPRLFLSIITLAFTIYMIPGLWGAPLKAISAWLPPQTTQDFDLYTNTLSSPEIKQDTVKKKYAGLFKAPHNLDAFFDYEQGLAYAKQQNKPVLIDFTGHSCVNCRKMEASVWSEIEVLNRLKKDYVLISLYVDDKTDLPESEQYISKFSGKKIKTIGNKWSDFQASTFQTNSQPYYVLVNNEGSVLVPPQAFNLDVKNYVNFLDSGLTAYQNKK
jgi:thiol:disulfide interchange protein DsbD